MSERSKRVMCCAQCGSSREHWDQEPTDSRMRLYRPAELSERETMLNWFQVNGDVDVAFDLRPVFRVQTCQTAKGEGSVIVRTHEPDGIINLTVFAGAESECQKVFNDIVAALRALP